MDVATRRADITIRFAGDSGDGMQVTGTQFTLSSAQAGHEVSTQPDYPAEIRAPHGTVAGVSGFQVHFGGNNVRTPGDHCDVLVAMNAAALKKSADCVSAGGMIIVDSAGFSERDLKLAGYTSNPLRDGSLDKRALFEVDISRLNAIAVQPTGVSGSNIDRSRNFFVLGIVFQIFSRPLEPSEEWIDSHMPTETIARANKAALRAGYAYAESSELSAVRMDVTKAQYDEGTYRNITGNMATALGLVAAAFSAGRTLFLGSYPITPASDILHHLSQMESETVLTFQAEDEIAAIASALGASYGGAIGVTSTSGPGLALKTETLGLAVMAELPLVIVDVQRAGPSTGMPTKTEQGDLFHAVFGRPSDSPLVVMAASSPADCFATAYQAVRFALSGMCPVIMLSDASIGNGSEAWRVPELTDLAAMPTFDNPDPETFAPYRHSLSFPARPWVVPGTPDLEHRTGGLEKDDRTGRISHDGHVHEHMVAERSQKIERLTTLMEPCAAFGAPKGVALVTWGSAYGSGRSATERLLDKNFDIGHVHLRYLNPLPSDLADTLRSYERIVCAEMNAGQLAFILRAYLSRAVESFQFQQGTVFRVEDLARDLEEWMIAQPQALETNPMEEKP